MDEHAGWSSFERAVEVAAPVEAVWRVLAEIGEIHRWNPGVVESRLTTGQAEGLGAARYCDLGGGNYLVERVAAWEEGRALTMEVTETNLPLEDIFIRFHLEPSETGTRVTLSPVYKVRFGPLGRLLDAVYLRRAYARGMEALLAGLRADVEAGLARQA